MPLLAIATNLETGRIEVDVTSYGRVYPQWPHLYRDGTISWQDDQFITPAIERLAHKAFTLTDYDGKRESINARIRRELDAAEAAYSAARR